MSTESVENVRGVRIVLRPLSERASQRRSLDERLFVRFPAAYRLLASTWMRLPPRSGLRRLMLTRLVRRGNAAVNRRDFNLVLTGIDPRIELHTGPVFPDVGAIFHGHDGFREVWREVLEAFEDFRFDPQELLDLGDRLLLTTEMSGHGAGSGVSIRQHVFQLFTLRRGLVVRQDEFMDHAEALEAAGLSE